MNIVGGDGSGSAATINLSHRQLTESAATIKLTHRELTKSAATIKLSHRELTESAATVKLSHRELNEPSDEQTTSVPDEELDKDDGHATRKLLDRPFV